MSISRDCFEDLNKDLFKETLETVEQALYNAKMRHSRIDNIVLVGGSTRIPKIRSLLQDFFGGKELNSTGNPDEAVACGAAIYAAVLSGDPSKMIKDVNLLDVNPMTLGIQIKNGVMSPLIYHNTIIPMEKIKEYATSEDNQTIVAIRVFEGGAEMVKDNNFLDEFELHGIPKASKGVSKIDVKFYIEKKNGILNVTGKDKKN